MEKEEFQLSGLQHCACVGTVWVFSVRVLVVVSRLSTCRQSGLFVVKCAATIPGSSGGLPFDLVCVRSRFLKYIVYGQLYRVRCA